MFSFEYLHLLHLKDVKLGPSSLDFKGDLLIDTHVIYGVFMGLII